MSSEPEGRGGRGGRPLARGISSLGEQLMGHLEQELRQGGKGPNR